MPESQRRWPRSSELVAWALFEMLEARDFDDATELHEEIARLEDMPPRRLHAELWRDSEEFREEFMAPDARHD